MNTLSLPPERASFDWPEDMKAAQGDPVAAFYDTCLIVDYGWALLGFVWQTRTFRLLGFGTLREVLDDAEAQTAAAHTDKLARKHILCKYNLDRHLFSAKKQAVAGGDSDTVLDVPLDKLAVDATRMLHSGQDMLRHKLDNVVPILENHELNEGKEWPRVQELKHSLEMLRRFIAEDAENTTLPAEQVE